jgi:hypothetical protein
MDKQEVVNQESGRLVEKPGDRAPQTDWDNVLPQAEFAYNDSVNRSTGKSPFEIVYGR